MLTGDENESAEATKRDNTALYFMSICEDNLIIYTEDLGKCFASRNPKHYKTPRLSHDSRKPNIQHEWTFPVCMQGSSGEPKYQPSCSSDSKQMTNVDVDHVVLSSFFCKQ